MAKRNLVCVLLLMGFFGARPPVVQAVDRPELEKQLVAYFNERMYNCCRSVVLTRQTGDTYEGFVVFVNGRRSDLKVTVTDRKIEYTFIRPTPLGRALGPASGADTLDSPGFTREMYDRIQKGMSSAQVAGILGTPGRQVSSSYFDGAVNEIRVWMNPDDSHICAVFQNGKVLVKTQFGLERISLQAAQGRDEMDYFDKWLLAERIDGRIVPLGLSFGQWIEKARDTLMETSDEPLIDIIEEGDRIILHWRYEDAGDLTRDTYVYLTCLRPHDPNVNLPEASEAERICVPSSVRIDGQEANSPAQAWKTMAALTTRPQD